MNTRRVRSRRYPALFLRGLVLVRGVRVSSPRKPAPRRPSERVSRATRIRVYFTRRRSIHQARALASTALRGSQRLEVRWRNERRRIARPAYRIRTAEDQTTALENPARFAR